MSELDLAVRALKAALLARVWDIVLVIGIVWVVYVLSLVAFGDWVSPLIPEWMCAECD